MLTHLLLQSWRQGWRRGGDRIGEEGGGRRGPAGETLIGWEGGQKGASGGRRVAGGGGQGGLAERIKGFYCLCLLLVDLQGVMVGKRMRACLIRCAE